MWELTGDLFNIKYYAELDVSWNIINPTGAKIAFNPNNPYQKAHRGIPNRASSCME